MAHLLRGKQAGVHNDLSAGITPDLLRLDDITRLGVNSQISQIAYDPVLSLLAIGTNDTKFGAGQIYVFGQKRVAVVLELRRRGSVKILQFCADRLLCLDSNNTLSVFSLDTKKLVASCIPPGIVNTIHSDPTLDYVFVGTQSGEILAYDLDREMMAPFKLPNFWRQQNPQIRVAPIISLQLHPRDVGKLLIGYVEGAVIYSFKQNLPVKFFHYELPAGAPGGDSDPMAMRRPRWPKLTQALWHPTGTFILTGHEDSSLVIWDAKDGRVVMARTLTDTNVDKPAAGGAPLGDSPATFGVKEPLFKIAWCANVDPDDTCILISGGSSTTMPTKGLTLFELGRTPNYATASWQVLSAHFENPKRQRILPSPPNAEVIDFCLIPRTSPHFAGAQDPIAALALLSSGELITLSFPSGLPITPTNQLHPSLTFVHPYISAFTLSPMERTRWLGLTENRNHGPLILRGGIEEKHVPKRFENRNVVQTAHADGTIRLWDCGHGDEIENDSLVQADVARAVGRFDNIKVTKMSLSGASAELVAGLESGEVVVFRWLSNKTPGVEPRASNQNTPRELTNIMDRRDPALLEGFHPFTLLDAQDGPITALKMSDVGFLAAGSRGGGFTVIDMRGPAIIFSANVTDFTKQDKKKLFRKSDHERDHSAAWATAIEFSVMTADDDAYSSILLHIGLSTGHLATLKILPAQSGTYTLTHIGTTSLSTDPILTIHPLHSETGHPCHATPSSVASLRTGTRTPGVLLATSPSTARVFKPASSRGASKSFDDYLLHAAAVTRCSDTGYALLTLCGDGQARAFSLPGLRELAALDVSSRLDLSCLSDAVITPTGDVLAWSSPSEMALLNLWGVGLDLNRSRDTLFDPSHLFPPRPTISNLQWISGTQYVTPIDLDVLIGGPDRPPSKKMIMQAKDEERTRLADERARRMPKQPAGGNDEGYWAYMQRQLNERAERLNIMGDSMDQLQTNSQGWADEVGKYVKKQKQNVIMGAVKSKFGF